MNYLKNIAHTFIYILAGITINTAIFITLFELDAILGVDLLWQIIGMSAVCSLGNLSYYSTKELSKNQMKLRIICHYLYVNVVVALGAYLMDWFSSGLIPQFPVMLLMIAVVYILIMVLTSRKEEKTAENLNKRLRKYYPSEEEDSNGDIK